MERRLCSIDASDVTGCSMCQRLIEPIAVATEQLLDLEDADLLQGGRMPARGAG